MMEVGLQEWRKCESRGSRECLERARRFIVLEELKTCHQLHNKNIRCFKICFQISIINVKLPIQQVFLKEFSNFTWLKNFRQNASKQPLLNQLKCTTKNETNSDWTNFKKRNKYLARCQETSELSKQAEHWYCSSRRGDLWNHCGPLLVLVAPGRCLSNRKSTSRLSERKYLFENCVRSKVLARNARMLCHVLHYGTWAHRETSNALA